MLFITINYKPIILISFMAPIGSQHTKTKPHLLLSAGYLFMFKLGTRLPPPPPGMKILSLGYPPGSEDILARESCPPQD